MKIAELIEVLKGFPADSEVVLEDLNGLWWEFEPGLIRAEEGNVVFGGADVNLVSLSVWGEE